MFDRREFVAGLVPCLAGCFTYEAAQKPTKEFFYKVVQRATFTDQDVPLLGYCYIDCIFSNCTFEGKPSGLCFPAITNGMPEWMMYGCAVIGEPQAGLPHLNGGNT